MADQTTTVAIHRLTENSGPWTHAAQIKYTDINTSTWTTNGDTVTVEYDQQELPTEFAVLRVLPYVKTAFSGSGTLLVEVGTDGDVNNYVTSTSITTAGPIATQAGLVPATLAGSFGSAGDDLAVRVTTEAASGAPADITAGDLRILYEIVDVDKATKGFKAP
jgi:hypothetical protein